MGKRIQRVDIDKMNTKLLELGYQDENIHTQVQIDCSSVLWDYPDATAKMTVQAPNGEKYPVVPALADNVVVWDVTDSDLVYAGSGKIQLTLKNGTEVIKSASCGTRIMESITTTGPAPTPLENWMQRAEETAEQIAETAAETVLDDYGQVKEDVTGLKSAFAQLDANVITESAGPAPIVSIADGADGMPMRSVEVAIEPVQDLHGYDSPWPAGGGVNKFNAKNSGIVVTNFSQSGETFTSTNVDGKTNLSPSIVVYNGNTVVTAVAISSSITQKGRVSGLVDITAECTKIVIKHNGSSRDFTITYPWTTQGQTTVSFDVQGYDCQTVGGIIIKDIVIASGNIGTTYTPYSNICPISGWTGAKVTRTGINAWDEEWEIGGVSLTTGENTTATNRIRSKNYIPVKPGTAYCLNLPWVSVCAYDADKNFIAGGQSNNQPPLYIPNAADDENPHPRTWTVPDGVYYIRFHFTTSYGIVYKNDSGVNYPVTDTTYHAYTGSNQISVNWETEAGTIYGGTLDVVSGKLVVNWANVDLGTISWQYQSNNVRFYSNSIMSSIKGGTENVISSMYVVGNTVTENGTMQVASNGYIYFKNTGYTDAITFKSAMSGQHLVYELATPITYDLTALEVLETLKGVNNIWSNTGDTSVTYPADTKLYIDRKITEAVANALNA